MANLLSTTIDDRTFAHARGTTAQRPPSPQTGMMRYNTDFNSLEFYNGTAWVVYEETGPVTDGLILDLDASATGGRSGNTWIDRSGVIGDVNIQNRSTDWSFTNDPDTNLLSVFNNSNRTDGNSPGINIPVNNGFNKLEGTFEAWLKPTGAHTGGHGWFNNSDGSTNTNATNWFWIGTWSTSDILYFRQGNPSTCCNDVTVGSFRQNWYPLDQWNHWTVTWSVSNRRASIYRNGALLLSRRLDMPTDIPNSNPTNTGQIFNGHARSDNMQFRGYCNIYKLYNRELIANEINRNYEFTRGRFGV